MTGARLAGVLTAMVALAALDLLGALCAKEYAERQRPLALAVGMASFLVLFGVYVAALKYAELSIVTMGWIVMLQVALLAIDQRVYGLHLDGRQWAAVAAILALQCYLIVSTSSAPADALTDAPAVAVAGSGPAGTTGRAIVAAVPEGVPTPYLVVDPDVVAERYAQLAAALPGVALHYAVKANPAPEVLERLVREGAWAVPGGRRRRDRGGGDPGRPAWGRAVGASGHRPVRRAGGGAG